MDQPRHNLFYKIKPEYFPINNKNLSIMIKNDKNSFSKPNGLINVK